MSSLSEIDNNFWTNNTLELIRKLIDGKELKTSMGTLIMADDDAIGFKMQNNNTGEVVCVGDLSFKQLKNLLMKDNLILI